MQRIFVVVLTCLLTLGSAQRRTLSTQRRAEQDVINTILNTDYYDSRINPGNDTREGPINISVEIYVRDIERIDDSKGEIKLQLTLRQRWIDSRLSFTQTNPENLKYVTIHDVSKIWSPDLFVTNERHAKLHDYARHNNFARIYPNGEVLNSQRVSLTLSCHMSFTHFPFDFQKCPIRLASYGHTNQDIVFEWQPKDPVHLSKDLELPKFTVEEVNTTKCDTDTKTGTYSCLKANLVFSRRFHYYLVHVFIPSIMLVILGWLAFWVDPKALVARLILGASTLGLMVIQTTRLNELIPQVSYTKSIDQWTGICLTFLFFALVESIVVNYWARSEAARGPSPPCEDVVVSLPPIVDGEKEPKEETNLIQDPEGQTKEKTEEVDGGQKQKKKGGKAVDAKKYVKKCWANLDTHSQKLDFTVRIVYPVIFVLFVILYFGICVGTSGI